MLLPQPRGPVSHWCVSRLEARAPALKPPTDDADADVLDDEDRQLALWMLYELHYQGFEGVDPEVEREPRLLSLRRDLERSLELRLRDCTRDMVDEAVARADGVADAIFDLCRRDESPSVAAFVHGSADREHMLEVLMHRSVYQLKEADPYSWVVPRLRGSAKAALLQILYDEYGCGRAADIHANLFADTLRACGLDACYGAYVGRAPAGTLAVSNTVSMFGLQRRLRGAAAGHLAAVEATSSLPSRKMSRALTRLGFDTSATRFFDEHVEADAVHEQVAARELCGALVEGEPELYHDVAFGAAACLLLEGRFSHAILTAWEGGRSSLLDQPDEAMAADSGDAIAAAR